jgi:hypothetical protein
MAKTGPKKKPLAERFWPKVEKTETCWLWTASLDGTGYGKIADERGRLIGAHIVSYLMSKGPVPIGHELDHTCRVTRCVNPAHLEPVTHKENILRGYRRMPQRSPCEHSMRRSCSHCDPGAATRAARTVRRKAYSASYYRKNRERVLAGTRAYYAAKRGKVRHGDL